MTTTTPALETSPAKRSFKLPSAYTILFGLIVLTAIATWLIPAGSYQYGADGSPVPGTYQEVEANPARIVIDSLMAPINGMYGIEADDSFGLGLELGRAVRSDRRRALHPRHRRLPGRHDADGRDPNGDLARRGTAARA